MCLPIHPEQNNRFFETFYEEIFKDKARLGQCYITYSVSKGFGLESKEEWALARNINVLFFQTSYSLTSHADVVVSCIKERLHKASIIQQESEKIQLSNELISAVKVIREMKKLLIKAERQREENWGLRLAIDTLKENYLPAIQQAALLSQISPLVLACMNGFGSQAVDLISAGIPVEDAGPEFYDFLFQAACKKEKWNLAIKLIEKGVTPRGDSTVLKKLFEFAEDTGKEHAALAILQQGINIHSKNDKGINYLHVACSKNLFQLVTALLEKNIDPNAQDNRGNTALHIACIFCNFACIMPLLTKNANIAITNDDGKTAFQALLNRRLGTPMGTIVAPAADVVKQFFMIIFHNFGFINELDESREIDRFFSKLENSPEKLIDHPQNNPDANPLFIPFLLQDESISKAIATRLGEDRFLACLNDLEKTYPHSNLDVLFFSPFTINREHLKKGIEQDNIPPIPRSVDLHTLINFFDEINFSNPKAPNYYDPEKLRDDTHTVNPQELKIILEHFINLICNRTTFQGTPAEGSRALQEFYTVIESAVKHVIQKLSSLENTPENAHLKAITICEYLRVGNNCAGKFYRIAISQYNKICRGIVLTFTDKIYQSLASDREICLSQAAITNYHQRHSVNNYNYVLRNLGTKLGIPGSQAMKQYTDPYGRVDDLNEVERKFFQIYVARQIQRSWIEPILSESDLRDSFIDWCKAHIPLGWRQDHFEPIKKEVIKMQETEKPRAEIEAYLEEKDIALGKMTPLEAIENERIYAFLGTCIFDMETNKIKPWAIASMLVELGIFSSVFSANTFSHQDTGNITAAFSHLPNIHSPLKLIGSFFTRLKNSLT